MNTVSEFAKLQQDMDVFCCELKLSHKIKLLFVVDFWPVCYFRIIEHCIRKNSLPYKVVRYLLLPLRPWIQGLSGSRIYQGAEIDGGLFLHHSEGVVIVDTATIGKNCTIYTGCCLVHKANDAGARGPTIGDNVRLMVGSKIIGAVKVGSFAVVGANAVVLQDIPDHAVAVGIPAKVIRNGLKRS